MLNTEVRERNGVVIADLSGRITMDAGDKVLHELVDDLLSDGHRRLVLNLGEVSYIDSSGLGELVGALRTARGMGATLKVLSPTGKVHDTLSVARLLPMFDVFQSEDDVVKSFADASNSGDEDDVLYEAIGSIACITLNRADRGNDLSRSLLGELVGAISAARRDRAVRSVVLTGAGEFFCAGSDTEELLEGRGAIPTLELYQTVIRDLAELPMPVIAALNGDANGAGLDLALACDLRVMADGASLASSFTKVGLVPDGGSTYHLPRLLGTARAAEMVLAGRAIDATESLAWGLVNRVVPSSEVLENAQRWAAELAAGPVRALGSAKRLLRKAPTAGLEGALAAEAEAQAEAFGSAELKEGLSAQAEERDPCFPES